MKTLIVFLLFASSPLFSQKYTAMSSKTDHSSTFDFKKNVNKEVCDTTHCIIRIEGDSPYLINKTGYYVSLWKCLSQIEKKLIWRKYYINNKKIPEHLIREIEINEQVLNPMEKL